MALTLTSGTVGRLRMVYFAAIQAAINYLSSQPYRREGGTITVEQCESYNNGYSDNTIGNSGVEVDDGPRNISFVKCYAHNNESRGFAVHTHGGVSGDVVCYNISFLECVAENNNNSLQIGAAYNDRNAGFAFSSASNTSKKVYDISIVSCRTTGHLEGGVLWYKSGNVSDSGLYIENCTFDENTAQNAGIRTYTLSDVRIINCKINNSLSRGVRVFDNRGLVYVSNTQINGSQLKAVVAEGSSNATRIYVDKCEIIIPAGLSRDSPVISVINCSTATIRQNRITGGTSGSTASGVFLGSSSATATLKAVVSGNLIDGVNVGVFMRQTTTTITGNTFTGLGACISNAINSASAVLYSNNLEISCISSGAAGADSATGNLSKSIQ